MLQIEDVRGPIHGRNQAVANANPTVAARSSASNPAAAFPTPSVIPVPAPPSALASEASSLPKMTIPEALRRKLLPARRARTREHEASAAAAAAHQAKFAPGPPGRMANGPLEVGISLSSSDDEQHRPTTAPPTDVATLMDIARPTYVEPRASHPNAAEIAWAKVRRNAPSNMRPFMDTGAWSFRDNSVEEYLSRHPAAYSFHPFIGNVTAAGSARSSHAEDAMNRAELPIAVPRDMREKAARLCETNPEIRALIPDDYMREARALFPGCLKRPLNAHDNETDSNGKEKMAKANSTEAPQSIPEMEAQLWRRLGTMDGGDVLSERIAAARLAGFAEGKMTVLGQWSKKEEARILVAHGITAGNLPGAELPMREESSQSSAQVQQQTRHKSFDTIHIETAKCDICNRRNTSILFRCNDCVKQMCSECMANDPVHCKSGPGMVITARAGSRQIHQQPPHTWLYANFLASATCGVCDCRNTSFLRHCRDCTKEMCIDCFVKDPVHWRGEVIATIDAEGHIYPYQRACEEIGSTVSNSPSCLDEDKAAVAYQQARLAWLTDPKNDSVAPAAQTETAGADGTPAQTAADAGKSKGGEPWKDWRVRLQQLERAFLDAPEKNKDLKSGAAASNKGDSEGDSDGEIWIRVQFDEQPLAVLSVGLPWQSTTGNCGLLNIEMMPTISLSDFRSEIGEMALMAVADESWGAERGADWLREHYVQRLTVLWNYRWSGGSSSNFGKGGRTVVTERNLPRIVKLLKKDGEKHVLLLQYAKRAA